MERFVISKSRPLEGTIDVRGAKNAAFPVLAATILTKEDCIIENLPLIEDVYRTLEILQSMGAQVDWTGERSVRINTKHLDPATIDAKLVLRFRGSVLFYGPLLARFGKVYLPQPGGCIIGARPIDTHLDAFSQLGAIVTPKKKGFEVRQEQKVSGPREVVLSEFSVTATENVLLYAALSPFPVTVKVADFDYQVQDLVKALVKMGVKVKTQDFHTLQVQGNPKLKGFRHKIVADPIEAGTFVLLGAAARGNIRVENVEFPHLQLFFKKLRDSGVQLDISSERGKGVVSVKGTKNLRIPTIQSWTYPGVHSDLQSTFGVLATQAKGSTLLHDPLYEGRLKYLEELNRMGAEIYFADPHRAIINGPTKLYGTDLGTFDLRGGAALIIAAIIAEGKSTISNIYQIDRGYEKIEERLQKLGADIKRVQD